MIQGEPFCIGRALAAMPTSSAGSWSKDRSTLTSWTIPDGRRWSSLRQRVMKQLSIFCSAPVPKLTHAPIKVLFIGLLFILPLSRAWPNTFLFLARILLHPLFTQQGHFFPPFWAWKNLRCPKWGKIFKYGLVIYLCFQEGRRCCMLVPKITFLSQRSFWTRAPTSICKTSSGRVLCTVLQDVVILSNE